MTSLVDHANIQNEWIARLESTSKETDFSELVTMRYLHIECTDDNLLEIERALELANEKGFFDCTLQLLQLLSSRLERSDGTIISQRILARSTQIGNIEILDLIWTQLKFKTVASVSEMILRACESGHRHAFDFWIKLLPNLHEWVQQCGSLLNDSLTPFICATFSGNLDLMEHVIRTELERSGLRKLLQTVLESSGIISNKNQLLKNRCMAEVEMLHHARTGNAECFKNSIEKKKIDINFDFCPVFRAIRDSSQIQLHDRAKGFGIQAIHIACKYGHTTLVKWMHQNGAAMDVFDRMNFTPIMYAVQSRQVDLISYLLDIGLKIPCEQISLFLEILRTDNPELVRRYIATYHIKIYEPYDKGQYFLNTAIQYSCCTETIRILIDASCQPKIKFNFCNWAPPSYLVTAARFGRIDVARDLVLKGFQITNSEPLWEACRHNQIEFVKSYISEDEFLVSLSSIAYMAIVNTFQFGHFELFDIFVERCSNCISEKIPVSETTVLDSLVKQLLVYSKANNNHSKVILRILASGKFDINKFDPESLLCLADKDYFLWYMNAISEFMAAHHKALSTLAPMIPDQNVINDIYSYLFVDYHIRDPSEYFDS